MIASPLAHPDAWLCAALNLSALVIATYCSVVLAWRFKKGAWIPLAAALLLTAVPYAITSVIAGVVPFVPYEESPVPQPHDGVIPVSSVRYMWDFIRWGIASTAALALHSEKARANQPLQGTPAKAPSSSTEPEGRRS